MGRFLDKANALLNRQQGRASIPTAQALMLMYLTMTCLGQRELGASAARFALDMIRRLELETRYTSTVVGTSTSSQHKALIAEALRGLVLLESCVNSFIARS